jgi:hypothetical protein
MEEGLIGSLKKKNKVGSTVHIYVEAAGMKTELDYEKRR